MTLSDRHRLVLVLVALVLAASGVARGANAPRVSYTAAGLKLAGQSVLRQSDLGAASVWVGGTRKPDLTHSPVCAGYHPNRADLVVTGAAASSYAARTLGLEVNSEAQVLRTPQMLALSWQRTVEPASVLSCMGGVFSRSAGSRAHVVSEARVSFPKVAPRTAAFRFLIDIGSGQNLAHYLVDFVVAGKGRVEIMMTTVAFLGVTRLSPAAEAKAASALAGNEAVLARRLVARATPTSPLAA